MDGKTMVSKLVDRLKSSLSPSKIEGRNVSKLEDRQGRGSNITTSRTERISNIEKKHFESLYSKTFSGSNSIYQQYESARDDYYKSLNDWEPQTLRTAKRKRYEQSYTQLSRATKSLSKSSRVAYGSDEGFKKFEKDINSEFTDLISGERKQEQKIMTATSDELQKYGVGTTTGAQIINNPDFVVTERYETGEAKTIVSKPKQYLSYDARGTANDKYDTFSEKMFSVSKEGKITKEVKQDIGKTYVSRKKKTVKYKPFIATEVTYGSGVNTPKQLTSKAVSIKRGFSNRASYQTYTKDNLFFNNGLSKKEEYGVDRRQYGSYTDYNPFLKESTDFKAGQKTSFLSPKRIRNIRGKGTRDGIRWD